MSTVLLVENEASVRTVLRLILTRRGVNIIEAADAAQALAVVDESLMAPDLLVTDVCLPGASGPQLAARLRERWPGMRVLYLSGLPAEYLVRFDLPEGTPVMMKPFRIGQFEQEVRENLEAGGGCAGDRE